MLALLGKVVGGGILGILLLGVLWTVSALFWGWILMLVLGAFHVHRGTGQVGYGECFACGYLLSLVLG